ncbi:MAG: glycosyltransferase [Cryomorphaceae bacterium]|nr:glycosyltransferase [Cryomorphaceae bacterium]MBL6682831.1 glycosyltransferase [Cryomorphaceae bacterium]MBL6868077.1 glycosyltransferase [Cryomorphaceae bacterium]
MKTPRVLHIVKWYPHAADPQNGVFVRKHIYATDSNPLVLGFLNHAGPPEHDGMCTLYGSKNMSTAAKWGAYFAKVKSVQPELIHFHCYAPDLAPLLWFTKRAGIKTVHSEHWSGFLAQHPRPLQGWRKSLARWYMNQCHIVLPVSSVLSDGIKALAPDSRRNIVPNIIDSGVRKDTEKRPCTSICVVADVVFSIKQQDKIFAAFSALPSMQFELHFYGGGPDESALSQMVKNHSNVFIHGRKSNAEILDLLPQHHALVLYSAYETFGITVLEARQAGLWAIVKSEFGCAPFYDEGCIIVTSDEALHTALEKVRELPRPEAAEFKDLSSHSIGKKLRTIYSKLLYA